MQACGGGEGGQGDSGPTLTLSGLRGGAQPHLMKHV